MLLERFLKFGGEDHVVLRVICEARIGRVQAVPMAITSDWKNLSTAARCRVPPAYRPNTSGHKIGKCSAAGRRNLARCEVPGERARRERDKTIEHRHFYVAPHAGLSAFDERAKNSIGREHAAYRIGQCRPHDARIVLIDGLAQIAAQRLRHRVVTRTET